jgi:hypothetical protein
VIKDPALESKYTLGSGNAVFHTCARCGIVPVVTSRIDGKFYAVVNVNSFEGVDPSIIRRESTNFDGEDSETRAARWKRNWIADVEYVDCGT